MSEKEWYKIVNCSNFTIWDEHRNMFPEIGDGVFWARVMNQIDGIPFLKRLNETVWYYHFKDEHEYFMFCLAYGKDEK